MKNFLIQCLKELEDLTGLRQLFYLQSDLENGKKRLDVLINGMLVVCKEFDYIPEEAQKSIISSQMIKDQEYDHLDSRVIWKWLNAFKGPYLNPKQLQDKPVFFEPISPEVQKEFDEWRMTLLDKPKPTLVEYEKEKIIAEDKARQEGEIKKKSESIHYKADPERIIMAELRKKYALECTDLYTGRVKEGCPSFEKWIKMDE